MKIKMFICWPKALPHARLLIFLFCVTSVVYAQDGTPLSAKDGVGAFTSFAGSWSSGMGNAGIALIGNEVLSRMNPATWTGLDNVQITGTYDFSGASSQDNTNGLSSYYANGNFGGGIFALPIDRNLGITLAGGFTPLTSYEFEISSQIDYTEPPNSLPIVPPATYESTGSGGLGEGFVGFSISPISGVNLGGMFNYAFGRMEITRTVNFGNSDTVNSYSDNSTYMSGSSGTFGIVIDSLDKTLGVGFLKGFSLAGYYKLSYNLDGNSVLENLYADTLYSPYSENVTGFIPPEFGIGIAEKFNDRLIAVLDFRAQNFSEYKDTFTPTGSLEDALFLGGGIEYLQGNKIGSLFDKRILRAGFYYDKTQFVLPTKSGDNKQVDELFLTAGIELPLSLTSTISFSAQYGLRGLSSDFLLRERIFRLYVSITMGEAWFMRPEGE
ncbi:MAG: hypothetical protein WAO19_01255 [Candidatus Kryptoniota bacterium]